MQRTLLPTKLIGLVLAVVIAGCTGGEQGRTLPITPTVTASSQSVTVVPATVMQAEAHTATPETPLEPTNPPTVTLAPTPTEVQPSPTLPPLTIQARDFGNATSRFDPEIEALLLANGYEANIIPIGDRRGLRASQRSYANSTWTRDLDYAITGYSYVLGDMSVLRENIELFLARVDADGVAPETIYIRQGGWLDHENRQAWDSLPNLIHAVYVYVAKTGDRDFYQTHRETVQRIGTRIVQIDSDDDGLPDGDNWPYGYYDSLYNSVMHTYAIAKFYAAYNELAELEEVIGADGSIWEQRAARLREGFHRPVDQGGYWLADQTWPIAWHRADGPPVTLLETFSIFAALRMGLITPADGARYENLTATMHELLPQLMGGPTPMRLALGGYEPEMRRQVDPPVPLWMLDASAPWIVGLAAPAYAATGYPEDARQLLQAYSDMARSTNPPVLEFAAGPDARYGPGNSGDGGRTWDSAAWFMAVYGGHYGLTFTPTALVVKPYPFTDLSADGIQNLSYQGAYVQFAMDAADKTYRIQADRPIDVRLYPMGEATRIRVNGGDPRTEQLLRLEPGQEYVVVSEEETAANPPTTPPPANGFFADTAFRQVWERTDRPLAQTAPGLTPRSWIWGPKPITGGFHEIYVDSPGQTRQVQYFDKSRMEVTSPAAPRNQWYVTNGLLVVELITGAMQVGNDSFEPRSPANVAVAGDPEAENPNAPTYRSFRTVAYPLADQPAPRRSGQPVTAVLNRDGEVTENPDLARYGVLLDSYDEQLGHNIPRVFTDFFAQQGLVYENGQYLQGQIVDWLFVVGLPISEPYWARVRVGGIEQDVLMQAFERRVLTYTPANDPAWRVEMGNVGQHYLRWRYGGEG
jgi:hypothetical protein